MENTSKQGSGKISRREVAYYRRRQQNLLFAGLAQFFANEAENGRITRKEIANKLGKDPAQISKWLSYPCNFEIDTISDLLLAMGAEMDHRIVRFVDRTKLNYAHPLTVADQVSTSASGSVTLRENQKARTFGSNAPQIQKESTAATTPSIRSKMILENAPI